MGRIHSFRLSEGLEGGEGSLVPSLIDTCNEETFREVRPLRPCLARAPERPSLERPGNRAGLGPRRRGGRATAHLPGALGPEAEEGAGRPAGRGGDEGGRQRGRGGEQEYGGGGRRSPERAGERRGARGAAESLHRPDAAATADAAAILIERSGCARLFPPERRSRRETPRALIPPPPSLASPPAFPPLPLHTRRTLHTPPRPPRRPPFPLPSGLPALGPPPRRVRPPRPARISVSGRKGNTKPARPRGESGETTNRLKAKVGNTKNRKKMQVSDAPLSSSLPPRRLVYHLP
ncbi:small nuclear ribonucleoprotein-associated protein N-like [Suricata suricatta]|uniref:small nuclear ribonucleoprotein-associated protein N-like n=1 Tax=Suricata suricatta TaxID=37032 RepID=UPI001155C10D|nr:small nuclear ribonucleoprotein-associated protein N-like [Suricata suricatta]